MCVIVGLYLFSEVVDGYLDEFMPFASLWTDWSYNIQSLHTKRLMRGHFEQQCWRCIYFVTMYLIFMVFSDIVDIVHLHGQLEVPKPLYLPCHCMPIAQLHKNGELLLFFVWKNYHCSSPIPWCVYNSIKIYGPLVIHFTITINC
jgi:hypothetical protein